MQLVNLASNVALALPDDFLWSDEHAWTPALVSMTYGLTGALLVQSAVRQAGSPITLVGVLDMTWVTRGTLTTLHAWAAVPLDTDTGRFALTFQDGRRFTVAFRHAETPIEAEPVTGFPARSDADFYRLTLRLLEV
jgi:hypothetical protein